MRIRPTLVLAHACLVAAIATVLAAPSGAHAGQTPESVVVVVNADSWASLTVANEYARLRHIPPANFVLLRGISAFDGMGPDQFRSEILGPVLQAIDDRGLRAQVDCIAYSVDLPSVIWVQSDMAGKSFPQVITGAASSNSVTYLHELFMKKDTAYLDLDINRYARRVLPLPNGRALTQAERAEYQRGVALYDQKKFVEAIAAIAPVLAEPCSDATVYYNFACCQALAGDGDGAMRSLARAADIGWRNHGQMTSDPDLASLFERAEFRALVDRMKAQRIEVQSTRGFRGSTAWNSDGTPAADGPRYLLSTMLGVTAGRGNSVNEVLECLQRAEKADGTAPKGTVYILRNGDVRSTTREWAFAPLTEALRAVGVAARVEDGVLPQGKPDVAGAVIGIADFKWADAHSTILPGAICEHLTSCGGMMGERDGQTPCTDFIRAGAAGSSGAVTEPYALQAKFPSPFIQWHYARGATLAEAFYQSLEGPYQLLVIGDPLCRPWGKDRGVSVEGAARGATMKGAVQLKPRGAPGEDPASGFEFFVDGRRIGACGKGETFALDTAGHEDGAHVLSVVATRTDAVESKDRAEYPVRFANGTRAVPTIKAPAKATWGKPIAVDVACEGASGIDIVHLGRPVARVEGTKGSARIEPALLGAGRAELRAIARFGTTSMSSSMSAVAAIEIELPPIKPARAPKETVPGLSFSVAKGAKSAVSDVYDPAWIASRAQDGKAFELTGFFDAPATDVWQVQLSTNTAATVEIDGVKLAHAQDGRWIYAPANLAAGTHRLRVTGKSPARAADARLDLRLGCAGTQHPTDARFRCELK